MKYRQHQRNKPKNPNWRSDNISPAQIWFLRNTLAMRDSDCLCLTKGEASDLITAHKFGSGKEYESVAPPMCSGNWTEDDPISNCGVCENCRRS